MDLSIITINYNLAKEIKECVDSVIDKLSGLEYEIIIVDNNSVEKESLGLSAEFQKEKYKNLQYYYLDKNVGFGKGCNFGAQKAKGNVLCFLNPDTLIKQNIFPELIAKLKENKSIGMAGPCVTENNKLFDYSAGFFPNIFYELLNVFFVGRYFEAFTIKGKAKQNKAINVDWVMGAALFIKTDVFNKVGGFDKDYFLYFEEVDLCYKVIKSGYEIIYLPYVSVFHHGSLTVKKDYSFFTKMFYKSKLIFIKKRYPVFKKNIIQSLMLIQIFSQLFLWTALLPLNKNKSLGKIKGLSSLITMLFKNVAALRD
jgi:GT2 family glycosyltransferase